MELTARMEQYLEEHASEAYDLLLELAQIPSPSNHEDRRAAFCKAWLEQQGAKQVLLDDALNVILPIGYDTEKPLIVFVAHSDVVFSDREALPLCVRDGRIYCPGVGDDTANVVAMLMAAKYIMQEGLSGEEYGILLVVNSAEEGLGNLNGTRSLMKTYGSRIKEFVSFDSWNGRINDTCVGSRRYRITVTTEGGHSYERFGNRNAIHYLASLIDTLYTVKVPEGGKTTFNVGTIQGGTSVNTIAQRAEMLYEFRSDNGASLDYMEQHLNAAVSFYRTKGVGISVENIGERPCMGDVDPEKHRLLKTKAADIIRKHYRIEPSFHSASTDCNIPLSMGIPSVALGCYNGDGAHTREEYVEIDSLLPGLKVALEMIVSCCRE